MKSIVLSVFPSVLLCACAVTNEISEVEPWSPASACVDGLSSLQARALPEGTKWLQFRDMAECLQSGDLNEPVVLFSLEALGKAAELDVIFHQSDSYVLAGRVEVLGPDFERIKHHDFDSFVFRGNRFTRRLFFNLQDDKPAYLLLALDHQLYGDDVEQISGRRVTTVWAAGGFMGAISDGTEHQDRLMLRDVGRFSISRVSSTVD